MQPSKDVSILNKKPIWYIFLLANVIILVSCFITWGMIFKGLSNSLHLPILICNLLATALVALFLLIEYRNTIPKIVHFQKKWLWWYLSAITIFVLSIIFNFTFYYFAIQNSNFKQLKTHRTNWKFLLHIIVISILTLVSIALQRYARFRIDLDIYRRIHGQTPSQDKKQQKIKNKTKSVDKDDTKNISSGLLQGMDKN